MVDWFDPHLALEMNQYIVVYGARIWKSNFLLVFIRIFVISKMSLFIVVFIRTRLIRLSQIWTWNLLKSLSGMLKN